MTYQNWINLSTLEPVLNLGGLLPAEGCYSYAQFIHDLFYANPDWPT